MRQRLINLRKTIECFASRNDTYSPVAKKMLMLGILSEMAELGVQLIEIHKDMSTELTEDDASIDFGIFEDYDQSILSSISGNLYDEEIQEAIINHISQFFPLNKDGYDFTDKKVNIIKNGMQLLSCDKNFCERDLLYALQMAQAEVLKTLISIDFKKKELNEKQYESFWYALSNRLDDFYIERADADYDNWKNNHESGSLQTLIGKRTQEMLRLLETGVFSHVPIINRDKQNCIIRITEDDLEPDMKLPDNIELECARMSKFIIKKKEIFYFDTANLGKYLYHNYNKISQEQRDALIYFDSILGFIQHDMAELKPQLKTLIYPADFDEEEEINEGIESIVSGCSGLLKPGVNIEFVLQYFKAAAKSNDNVVESLNRKSKKTKQICQMLGMLISTTKIFAENVGSKDIAKALSIKIKKPQPDSLRSYIDKGKGDHKGKLHKWTSDYINKHFVKGTTNSAIKKDENPKTSING